MTLNLDRTAWQKVKFAEFAENVNDRVDDPKTAGVSRYVGLEHLDPGSLTVNRWGTPDQVEATKLRFKPGDVIFGRRRAYQKKVARADFEGICSAHAMVLRANPGVVEPDFLPVFLSSDYFLERAIKISVGSLSPTVNWKTLAVQEFELPPLDQQRRIADLLWAIQSSRQATAVQRESLTVVRQAFRHATFKRWHRQFECQPLAGSFDFQLGKMVSERSNPTAEDAGFPYLGNIDVRWREFSLDQLRRVRLTEAERSKYRLEVGDVLVCEGRGVGRSAVWAGELPECYYQKALHRLRAKPSGAIKPATLVELLQWHSETDRFRALVGDSLIPHLTEVRFKTLRVPTPPREEQERFLGLSGEFDLAASALDEEGRGLAAMTGELLSEVFPS